MEESVSLLVRSPAGRHPDLSLRAEPSGTVRQLKARLRRLLPEAPPEEEQKLIYLGKLLPDHLYLRDVLPTQEKLYVLHLVYNSKSRLEVQETSSVPKALSEISQDPSVASADEARHRDAPCNQPTVETNTRIETARGFSAYTTYSMLQISWFQQIYARQYYMQYLVATAADPLHAQRSQEIPVAPVAAPAPLPDPFPAQNQPGNQNVPPQVNPAANQNLQMNAQGGPLMEEEEDGNRDWLDWLYSATLFYVFVNIIYFYSSVSRFIIVMGGSILMYLHQVGWFPFRRRLVQPFPNNVPPQDAINQDQNNNLQQEENADGSLEAEVFDEGSTLPEGQQGTSSLMSTVWLFFKTFFASLLPEGPPALPN